MHRYIGRIQRFGAESGISHFVRRSELQLRCKMRYENGMFRDKTRYIFLTNETA